MSANEKVEITDKKCGDVGIKKAELEQNGLGVRHLQMALMGVTLMVLYIVRGNISVTLLAMTDPRRANDSNVEVFSWDKKAQGLIMSSFFWSYLMMQIPAGLLAKKFGGKPLLMLSLVANSVLCFLSPSMVYYGGWNLLLVSRVAMGLTQSFLLPCTHTLLARWLPAHERTTYVGFVYGGTKLGTIVALPLGGLLADTALGWRLIFYATGALLAVHAAVWWWLAASTPSEHWMVKEQEREYIERGLTDSKTVKNFPTPWKAIFSSKPLWGIISSQGAFVLFYMFFISEMPSYLEKALHISLKSSALLSALPYVGMWLSGILSATMSDKLVNGGYLTLGASRKIANCVANFGTAAGLVCMCFIGPEHKTLGLFVLIGSLSCGGFFVAGFMGNHLDLSPNFGGVIFAISNCLATVFGLLEPIFTSFILQNDPSDVSRWRVVFITVASVVAGLNVICLVLGSAERQPWDTPNYQDSEKCQPDELEPALEKKKKEDSRHISK